MLSMCMTMPRNRFLPLSVQWLSFELLMMMASMICATSAPTTCAELRTRSENGL